MWHLSVLLRLDTGRLDTVLCSDIFFLIALPSFSLPLCSCFLPPILLEDAGSECSCNHTHVWVLTLGPPGLEAQMSIALVRTTWPLKGRPRLPRKAFMWSHRQKGTKSDSSMPLNMQESSPIKTEGTQPLEELISKGSEC